MKNREKKITEIKTALEKYMRTAGNPAKGSDELLAQFGIVKEFHDKSPEWIRYLLDELEGQQEEIKGYEYEAQVLLNGTLRDTDEIERLREENELLRKIRVSQAEMIRKGPDSRRIDVIMSLRAEIEKIREERKRIENAAMANLQQFETEKAFLTIKLQSAQQEIERLKEKLDEETQASDEICNLLNETKRRLNIAEDREQNLIEGLRFYATKENHEEKFKDDNPFDVILSPAQLDKGELARAIFKEIGVTEKCT